MAMNEESEGSRGVSQSLKRSDRRMTVGRAESRFLFGAGNLTY